MLVAVFEYLTDPAFWLPRLLEHVRITIFALGLALVVAFPLGVYVGETGHGATVLVGFTNAMRALPTLGLVTFLYLILRDTYATAILGLVVLAVPPVLAGTYSGLQACDDEVTDAAMGIGMSRWQRLWRVKLPIATPILFGGIRNAVLQLVATATVAAYISLGGLGRLLLDGLALQDYPRMVAGAILTGLLAVILDLIFAGVQRATVPTGARLSTTASAPSERKGDSE